MESHDKKIIIQILNEVLHVGIKEIKYNDNTQLENNSEYEFELVKVRANLKNGEEVEIYLKMIKNSKIKESIFCYWCAIYEEELNKSKEMENVDAIVNKVLISELNQNKYQQRIFLTIENNKTSILTTGTEVNFLDIFKYIEDKKSKENQFEELYKYFNKDSNDVLLVGIKKVENKAINL